MNSFKTSNNSSDRVDPKMVTPSRHSVFIRGFPSNMPMENVRTFFKNESKENCKIDFFSYSEDRKKLFIALRFETHEKAIDIIENFDNKEVLGHNIEVSWFKDLRKARKQLIEEERASRNNESSRGSPGVDWMNMIGRNQAVAASGYGRNNGMCVWHPGGGSRFIRNSRGAAGMRTISGGFNRQQQRPDCYQRQRVYQPGRGNTGCWRRARLSPNRYGSNRIVRRDRTPRSRSRSADSHSGSPSRSRSRSRSYSSKRSYSSYSSRKSRDKSSSNKDIGHDSVHKYRFNRSHSLSSDRQPAKRPNSFPDEENLNTSRNQNKNDPLSFCKIVEDSLSERVADNVSPNIVHAYSITASESSASSNELSNKQDKASNSNNKKHKKKSRKKSKKRKTNKKSKDSEDNSSGESGDEQRGVEFSQPGSKNGGCNDEVIEPVLSGINNAPQISIRDDKDNPGDLVSIKCEYPNLTAEDHVKVLTKKESLEKAYKKDCETVASVSRLIISKNPGIEETILIILKSIFSDIGDKYIDELRSYVAFLGQAKTNEIL